MLRMCNSRGPWRLLTEDLRRRQSSLGLVPNTAFTRVRHYLVLWTSHLGIRAPAHRHHILAMARTPATRVTPGPAELRSGAHASDRRGDLHVHLWRRPLGWRLHPIQAGRAGKRRGSMASFATMAVSLALRGCRADPHRVLDECPAGASADR